MKTLRGVLSPAGCLALVLGLAACTGERDEPGGDEQDLHAQLGEPCGQDVAIQRECAAGLRCVFDDSTGPISEHTPGTCVEE